MPGILDWTYSPWTIVDRLYLECNGEHKGKLVGKVEEYFKTRLEDRNLMHMIPSIPETPLHLLHDGQLVRFRCQVQDQYDDEIYDTAYFAENAKTKRKRKCCTYFREIMSYEPDEHIIRYDGAADQVLEERAVRYCISLPGQNDWVTQAIKDRQPVILTRADMARSSSNTTLNKRSLEDNEDCNMDTNSGQNIAEISEDVCKRLRVSSEAANEDNGSNSESGNNLEQAGPISTDNAGVSGPVESKVANYNLPIPDPNAIACLVKVYGQKSSLFKINAVLDVVGIVCLYPATLQSYITPNQDGELFTDPRGPACRLPCSFVPRLHAVWCKELPHSHPTLPLNVERLSVEEARECRELLRTVLEEACLGDPIAGDYLIACLLGSVQNRRNLKAIGQLSLNLSGITPELSQAGFVPKLYGLLQQLCSHTHLQPFTVLALNEKSFCPVKDYDKNELRSGCLQLPRHTVVVFDETAMQPGILAQSGINNLSMINEILRSQVLQYNFEYHKIEIETDLNILIFSEGSSMLKCECEVVLEPEHMDIEAAFAKVKDILTDEVKERLRAFIVTTRLADYDLSPDIRQAIQDEFVRGRELDAANMSVDKFSTLLSLGRLVAISCGEKDLTQDIWKSCKILENKRWHRIDRRTAARRH